jgi:hypothetical protein
MDTVTVISDEPGAGVVSGGVTDEPTAAKVDFQNATVQFEDVQEDEAALRARYGENYDALFGEVTDASAASVAANTDVAGASDPPANEAAAVVPVEAVAAQGETEQLDLEELKKLAEFGKTWKQAFTDNPEQTLLGLLSNAELFPPEKREALLSQVERVREQKEAEEIDLSDYEPQGELEQKIISQVPWIMEGQKQVQEALMIRDQDIQTTFVAAESTAAKVDAICEFLGIKLPDVDNKAILDHYDRSPEDNLKSAVAKVYREAALKAARIAKQQNAERPGTPRTASSTGSTAGVNKVNSMSDAFDKATEILAAEGFTF